jgi:hypothetical protein
MGATENEQIWPLLAALSRKRRCGYLLSLTRAEELG